MYAYSNILAALLHRQQTGRGQHIDISMLESLVEWMNYPLYYAFDGAPPPARTGASHATIYPYGPFPAGDGKVVMLGLQNEREWARVLREGAAAAGAGAATSAFRPTRSRSAARAELARDHRRSIRRADRRSRSSPRLDDAQIANARVNDDARRVGASAAEGAQALARGRTRRRARCRRCCRPARGRRARRAWIAVPALGAHTDAILGELGYSAERIAALRAEQGHLSQERA